MSCRHNTFRTRVYQCMMDPWRVREDIWGGGGGGGGGVITLSRDNIAFSLKTFTAMMTKRFQQLPLWTCREHFQTISSRLGAPNQWSLMHKKSVVFFIVVYVQAVSNDFQRCLCSSVRGGFRFLQTIVILFLACSSTNTGGGIFSHTKIFGEDF